MAIPYINPNINLAPADTDQPLNTYAPSVGANSAQEQVSAVSWGAIVAGAAAAAALSLIMLILGTGLGLSSVSPWAYTGVTAATFGITTILWVTVTQLLASGMGGYIAGRLRSNWFGTQSDEIYFRDTAHGFLAWAVASLMTAALLSSVIGSIVGGGIQAGATVAGGAATTASSVAGAAGVSALSKADSNSETMGYFFDSLFRSNVNEPVSGRSKPVSGNNAEQESVTSQSEVTRIFNRTILTGPLPVEDARHVGQIVAQRTGLSQDEAEKRAYETYARMQAELNDMKLAAKDAADTARKASAYTALWLFISLLIGAFIASWAATYGGRHRDL